MYNFNHRAQRSHILLLKRRRLYILGPIFTHRCFLEFVALVAIVLAAKSTCASEARELADIKSIWRHWDRSVHTFEFKGFKIQLALRLPENLYRREQLMSFLTEKLLPEVEKKGGSVNIDTITQLLPSEYLQKFDKENPTKPLGSIRPFSLVEDNGKTRLDELLDGRRITTIRTSLKDVQYIGGVRQADIYRTQTNYRVENHDHFLYQPQLAGDNASSSVSSVDNRLKVEAGLSSTEVDSNTGFVTMHSISRPDGSLLYERLQYLPFTAGTAGIPFPRVLVEARYFNRANAISIVNIYVCIHAFVNHEISEDCFALDVPAGTKVVDHSLVDHERSQRDGAERYIVNVAGHNIKDVERYSLDSAAKPSQVYIAESASWASGHIIFLCVNILTILAILIFIMRKRRRAI